LGRPLPHALTRCRFSLYQPPRRQAPVHNAPQGAERHLAAITFVCIRSYGCDRHGLGSACQPRPIFTQLRLRPSAWRSPLALSPSDYGNIGGLPHLCACHCRPLPSAAVPAVPAAPTRGRLRPRLPAAAHPAEGPSPAEEEYPDTALDSCGHHSVFPAAARGRVALCMGETPMPRLPAACAGAGGVMHGRDAHATTTRCAPGGGWRYAWARRPCHSYPAAAPWSTTAPTRRRGASHLTGGLTAPVAVSRREFASSPSPAVGAIVCTSATENIWHFRAG